MSADIRRILNAPDKLVHEAEDVLARLFRKMLMDIQMTDYHWIRNMRQYLDDPSNRIPNTPSHRSSVRGNLNKELAGRTMTWNVFIKGLKFLGPTKFRFVIVADWNPNRVTHHELEMQMATREIPAPVELPRATENNVRLESIWPTKTLLHELKPRPQPELDFAGMVGDTMVGSASNDSGDKLHEIVRSTGT